MKNPSQNKLGYLPTLDGWRALAILAVIFHHDTIHSLGPLNTKWLYAYGSIGVDVFFAISGILICSRLLDEEHTTGSIHLKQFYIRRAFRILPPALLYLFFIALLSVVSIIAVSPREWFESLLFCRNYPTILGKIAGQTGWYTEHFWSLSLEEQFYFILPAVLVLSAKRYRTAVLAGLAAAIIIHRAIALHSHSWSHIGFHADVRLDALLVPALFAVVASNPTMKWRLQRALRFWPALTLLILCIIPFGTGSPLHITILVLLMPCIVLGSVLNPANILGRILEWSGLRYIGRISYSLYLWQQLFFTQHFGPVSHLGIIGSWPLRLTLTFTFAIISYYVVEKPLVRIGHRWAPSINPRR